MDKQNTKRKILYVITKGNWGGAQRYVYDLATNLDKKEFDVLVASGAGDTLINKLSKARIRNFQIVSLDRDVKIGNDFKVFFELLRIFKTEQPDIVHVNSSKIGALGTLAVRIHNLKPKSKKLKAIFTAHGWPFKEDRNIFTKHLIKFLSWLTVIFSHTTIVVSQDDFEKSKNFPFTQNKIRMIHNGVGNLPFKDGFVARQFLGHNISQGTWIGTIAELTANKGLDRLIRGYAETATLYQDSALIIIGNGEEESKLKDLVHELQIEKQVYFLGHIDNASQYLKAFDIFCLTSRKEGLPYALLEAGRAELGVLASRVGGIPEIIEHEKTGLLIDTEKDIYENLNRLLLNSEERSSFGKELKKKIQSKFNAEDCREKTYKIYKNFI